MLIRVVFNRVREIDWIELQAIGARQAEHPTAYIKAPLFRYFLEIRGLLFICIALLRCREGRLFQVSLPVR